MDCAPKGPTRWTALLAETLKNSIPVQTVVEALLVRHDWRRGSYRLRSSNTRLVKCRWHPILQPWFARPSQNLSRSLAPAATLDVLSCPNWVAGDIEPFSWDEIVSSFSICRRCIRHSISTWPLLTTT